ncbi:MAG: hypothetical protein U0746_17780 [Gemmataceae bacterium]
MDWAHITICTVGATGSAAVLYAIHRRYRWLEERGFIGEPKSSGGGPFLALREFVEPTTQHIHQVNQEQQHKSEREAGGEGDAAERGR